MFAAAGNRNLEAVDGVLVANGRSYGPGGQDAACLVFAHPDDESMGPGATFAKYAAAGHRVAFLTATDGADPAQTATQLRVFCQFEGL